MNMLKKLDILMAERGINKSQLAIQSGIPKTTIYGWYKKGYEGVRRTTLKALADFFGVTMEYLTNDDIDPLDKEKPLPQMEEGPKAKAHQLLDQIPEERLHDIMNYMEYLKSKKDKE